MYSSIFLAARQISTIPSLAVQWHLAFDPVGEVIASRLSKRNRELEEEVRLLKVENEKQVCCCSLARDRTWLKN